MRKLCDCGKPTNNKAGYKLFGNFCSTKCKEKYLKKIKPLLKEIKTPWKILLTILFLVAFYKFADGLCKEIQDQIL